MANRKLVRIEKCERGAWIVPEPESADDIRECSGLDDILEWQMCNGWDHIEPEEVGALTDGLIITDDSRRDEHGRLVSAGRVYWFASYQVEDAVETLAGGKSVWLVAAD